MYQLLVLIKLIAMIDSISIGTWHSVKASFHTILMTISFQLDKAEALSSHLGHPGAGIPAYIHVGGVLGKTSTVVYLTRILRACTSLRIGSFVHPWIISPRHCILINEQPVEESIYSELMRHVQQMDHIFRTDCTFYEKLVMTALMAFKTAGCDLIVVESALGGTFDATNVLGRDGTTCTFLAVLLTKISLDHTKYLGGSVHSIATNIAGLVKPDVPVLISEDQPPEALEAFSSCHIYDNSKKMMLSNRFFIQSPPHQQAGNVELALRTFHSLTPTLEEKFKITCHPPFPGVLSTVHLSSSFVHFFYLDRRVILDSAQNGGANFCHWTRNVAVNPEETIHLVIGLGIKEDSVLREFFAILGARPEYRFSFVDFSPPEGYPWIHSANRGHLRRLVADLYESLGIQPIVTNYTSLQQVLTVEEVQDSLILIFGSPHIVRDFYRVTGSRLE